LGALRTPARAFPFAPIGGKCTPNLPLA
jgi:hypothetical protein